MKPVVLVTDTDKEFLALAGRFLGKRGLIVCTASVGLECLEKLVHLSPEVLVLDRELPWGGSGNTFDRLLEETITSHTDGSTITSVNGLLDCLREEWPDPPHSVILTTAENDLPAGPLGAPVVRWLRKPYTPERLLSIIEAAVESHGGTRGEAGFPP